MSRPLCLSLVFALVGCAGTGLPNADRLPDEIRIRLEDGFDRASVDTATDIHLALSIHDAEIDTCYDADGTLSSNAVTARESVRESNDDAFVITHLGNVLERPSDDPVEGEPLPIIVIGPARTLALTRLAHTAAADPNERRYSGSSANSMAFVDAGEVDPSAGDSTCSARRVVLGDFPAGNQSFTLRREVGSAPVVYPAVPFSVRRKYVGTVTFGGLHSWLSTQTYREEPVRFDTTGGPFRLTAESARSGGHIVAGFAPALYSVKHGLGARPAVAGEGDLTIDPFVGVSVTRPTDDLFGGVAVGVLGILHLTAGGHLSSVKAIPEEAGVLDNELVNGYPYRAALETSWRTGWFVGVSLDARSAATALGKTARAILTE
ncbi:MAG: hypothetical protein AAF791_00595 [Bacteroidota bacterium]